MDLMSLIIYMYYITIVVGSIGIGLVIWSLVTHRERIYIERLNQQQKK